MKKFLGRIKISLATLWTAIISFPFKIMADFDFRPQPKPLYGVPDLDIQPIQQEYGPLASPAGTPIIAIKIAQILLIAIIFIVGIVNFIRIKKIDDKAIKKKKIRNTIIIIAILVLILIASFVISHRLLTK